MSETNHNFPSTYVLLCLTCSPKRLIIKIVANQCLLRFWSSLDEVNIDAVFTDEALICQKIPPTFFLLSVFQRYLRVGLPTFPKKKKKIPGQICGLWMINRELNFSLRAPQVGFHRRSFCWGGVRSERDISNLGHIEPEAVSVYIWNNSSEKWMMLAIIIRL